MKFDVNDPKWTAYALGELESAERAVMEAALNQNPSAQALVAELKAAGGMLRSALAAEPAPRLKAEQLALLESAVAGASPELRVVQLPVAAISKRSRRRWAAVLGAVAVSALILVLVLPALEPARETAKRLAFGTHLSRTTTAQKVSTTVSKPLETSAADLAAPADRYTSLSSAGAANTTAVANDTRDEIQSLDLSSSLTTVTEQNQNQQAASARPKQSTTASVDVLYGRQSSTVAPAHVEYADGASRLIYQPIDAIQYKQRGAEVQTEIARLPMGRRTILGEGVERSVRRLKELSKEELEAAPTAGEAYELPQENAFESVAGNPLSTFSIDVDTASYANVRRFLMQNGQLPPPAAVRIEEMINYFRYDYPQPEGDVPFSLTTEVATCPWNTDHRLARIGLKGKEIAREKRPVSNLVFLLDVSGSMQDANKLPLVRESMKLLVRELSENDRVAIVVYAGASGLVLNSTTGDQKDAIRAAIERLQAGGSTNGAGGLQQAYDVAMQHFVRGGVNRVILATDGDFNVGITDRDALVRLIEDKAKSGVSLTTLGFGMGNLKDATLEQIADKGNGNYAYVDTLGEARKVLVEEMSGTLITIAKDVKVQIEFNPAEVASYRLIGYENRVLAAEDFNNDQKDAGEIGAGHTVTALYELTPLGKADVAANSGHPAAPPDAGVDPLRYQKSAAAKVELTDAAGSGELFTLKLRYKQPDGDTSKLIEHPVKDSGKAYRDASGDFKFASAVAAFGMALRHSQYRGTLTLDGIKELAVEGQSFDPGAYRSEMVTLIERAQALGAK
jgi:Ca-activated chloride channel family protein